MIYDISKASMWKRISAYLLDMIILILVVVEVAFLLSLAFNFNGILAKRNEIRDGYEEFYGVDFDITQEEYDKLSKAEIDYLNDAYAAFVTDPEAGKTDEVLFNVSLAIASLSFLISYFALEFVVPQFLKNGQTIGKRIFSIAVVRVDGVKISNAQLFIRTVLGKCTVGTLIPVFLAFLLFLNIMPLFCIVGFAMLVILQFICIVATKLHTPIHELMSATVSVDMTCQRIFNSSEELMEYKKQLHAQEVERADYH